MAKKHGPHKRFSVKLSLLNQMFNSDAEIPITKEMYQLLKFQNVAVKITDISQIKENPGVKHEDTPVIILRDFNKENNE